MREWFELSRIFASLLFLTISSWYDYKLREVPNRVWAFFAPTAFALISLQLCFDHLMGANPVPVFWLLSFAVTAGISLLLFYAGFFGGADAKALICMAIALPVYPSLVLLLSFPHPEVHKGQLILSKEIGLFTLLWGLLLSSLEELLMYCQY